MTTSTRDTLTIGALTVQGVIVITGLLTASRRVPWCAKSQRRPLMSEPTTFPTAAVES